MRCDRWIRGADGRSRCGSKARMFVAAYGGKSWNGYYCEKHAISIIVRRRTLIKKYRQNVVMRYVTKFDRKRRK